MNTGASYTPFVLNSDHDQEGSSPAQRPLTPPGQAIEQSVSVDSSPLSSLPSSLLSSPHSQINDPPSPSRLTSAYANSPDINNPPPCPSLTAVQLTSSHTFPANEALSCSLPTPNTSPRRSAFLPLSQEDEEEIERLTANVAGYLLDFRNTAASARPRLRERRPFQWTLRPTMEMIQAAKESEVLPVLPGMDVQESRSEPSRWFYDTENELWTYLDPASSPLQHTAPEASIEPSQDTPIGPMTWHEVAPASLKHEQDTPKELVAETESVQMDSLPSSASGGHEFEAETSLRRQDSRNITEAGEKEPLVHKAIKTGEHAGMETSGQHDHEETATGHEDVSVTHDLTISDHILQALTAKKKKVYLGSSVAIVLDVHDLSKTFICPSKYIQDQISTAPLRTAAKYQAGEVSMHMFTLDVSEAMPFTPILNPLGSMGTLETLRERGPGLFLLPSCESSARHASSQRHRNVHESTPRNWTAVFETLRMMVNMKEHSSTRPRTIIKQLGVDASTALPVIEGIIVIARLDSGLLGVVSSILPFIILEYIGNLSLYSAIAVKPASWLLIGITLQNSAIFKEAFCHIAAQYPAWPWADKSQTDLPRDVLSAIKSKARELEFLRISIDRQLSMLSLKAPHPDHKRSHLQVSHRNHPSKYEVLNFWWNWVAQHLGYMDATSDSDKPHTGSRPTDFCNHTNESCLSRASFYRALAKGGDAYLTFDELLVKLGEAWLQDREPELAEMRSALAELKHAAAQIVAPLVQSSLHLRGSAELGYLSCVWVGEEEMVWKKEEVEEQEDGDGGAQMEMEF